MKSAVQGWRANKSFQNIFVKLGFVTKENIRMSKIKIVLCVTVVSILLTACGSKDYTGCYVYDSGQTESEANYAMQIYEDGIVVLMQSCNAQGYNYIWAESHLGYIEKDRDSGLIYFRSEVTMENNGREEISSKLARFSPLKLVMSDDGERAYLVADSDNFNTLTFNSVSEKRFNNFINETSIENHKLFDKWDGNSFMSYNDFWNQDRTALDISPIIIEEAAPVEEAAPAEEAAY